MGGSRPPASVRHGNAHGLPHGLQRALGLMMAVVSTPVVGALAILVRLDSRGGALYIADRVGAGGQTFRLVKLRTMRVTGGQPGPGVSVGGDPRVTRIGRFLRRTRLDELPQLWHVVRGEMLLVGPRPEDPRFVDLMDPLHRRVFTAIPGITGITQLAYSAEADLLDASDPEAHYRLAILPEKLQLDAEYLDRRSVGLDMWILVQTVKTAAGHPPSALTIRARLRGVG